MTKKKTQLTQSAVDAAREVRDRRAFFALAFGVAKTDPKMIALVEAVQGLFEAH